MIELIIKFFRQIEEVTDNPMRLRARHFPSANKNKTPSGKQAMPDCVCGLFWKRKETAPDQIPVQRVYGSFMSCSLL